MNLRTHKRRLADAQRAWSRSNVTCGWVPILWYAPRHPRIVSSRLIPAALGHISRFTLVVTSPSSTS